MNKSKEEIVDDRQKILWVIERMFNGNYNSNEAKLSDILTYIDRTLTTHSQNREAEIRKEENRLFMETMQKRADTVPPNLLLNEIVNYTYDRIEALTPEQLEDKQ